MRSETKSIKLITQIKEYGRIRGKGKPMKKQKSLSSLKKRIKVTSTGKYLRHKAGKRHLASSKTRARKRSLSGATVVHKTFTKKMQRLLPGY